MSACSLTAYWRHPHKGHRPGELHYDRDSLYHHADTARLMWLLVAAVLGGVGFFFFRRWRKRLPIDQRLSLPYWRNSLVVVGAYLLSILLGAGITRVMVGFNRSGWADLLMVAFFMVWTAYGAVWLLRFLPTTRPRAGWLMRARGWIDALALLLLAGLATGARLL